jgi:hypothetical protein
VVEVVEAEEEVAEVEVEEEEVALQPPRWRP